MYNYRNYIYYEFIMNLNNIVFDIKLDNLDLRTKIIRDLPKTSGYVFL